jgi:cobalamin biosynthesis protein CbiG
MKKLLVVAIMILAAQPLIIKGMQTFGKKLKTKDISKINVLQKNYFTKKELGVVSPPLNVSKKIVSTEPSNVILSKKSLAAPSMLPYK